MGSLSTPPLQTKRATGKRAGACTIVSRVDSSMLVLLLTGSTLALIGQPGDDLPRVERVAVADPPAVRDDKADCAEPGSAADRRGRRRARERANYEAAVMAQSQAHGKKRETPSAAPRSLPPLLVARERPLDNPGWRRGWRRRVPPGRATGATRCCQRRCRRRRCCSSRGISSARRGCSRRTATLLGPSLSSITWGRKNYFYYMKRNLQPGGGGCGEGGLHL